MTVNDLAGPGPRDPLGERAQAPGGTARRIEDAALALFFERGYAATTMREIALACGITAGALYNHFASKEAILASVVGKVHDELERLIVEAIASGDGDPARELHAVVRAHALFHTRFRHEARVANQEIGSLPDADRALIVDARKRMRRIFEAIIERGIAAGTFDVADTLATTLAILNMGIRIADWFRPDARLSDERIADLHAELALRMVGAR